MVSLKIRKPTPHEIDNCELVELTNEMPWHPEHLNDKELSKIDYGVLVDTTDKRHMAIRKTRRMSYDPKHYNPYFLYPGYTVMVKTLENTTQYGSINMRVPMQQHYKSRNPLLQRRRINEPYATDTWFSTVTSYEGYNSAQIFYGIKSGFTSHYGMQRETQGPEALLDFFRNEGVPISITHDNSHMQVSHIWKEYCRRFWVKDKFIEPYHPHQNPAERAMAIHKNKIQRLMIDTGCEPEAWFRAACHVADIHNHTAKELLGYRTPTEVRDWHTPDISALIQFQFWDEVYYMEHTNKFPHKGANEGKGHWVGRAIDYGDKLCHYILTDDTHNIIVRSMVRAVRNSPRPNHGLPTIPIMGESHTTTPNNFPIIRYADKTPTQPLAPKLRGRTVQFDPDELLNIYVYDTYTTKTGNNVPLKAK